MCMCASVRTPPLVLVIRDVRSGSRRARLPFRRARCTRGAGARARRPPHALEGADTAVRGDGRPSPCRWGRRLIVRSFRFTARVCWALRLFRVSVHYIDLRGPRHSGPAYRSAHDDASAHTDLTVRRRERVWGGGMKRPRPTRRRDERGAQQRSLRSATPSRGAAACRSLSGTPPRAAGPRAELCGVMPYLRSSCARMSTATSEFSGNPR